MEVHGRIAGSSNATLLVTCRLRGRGAARRLQAVEGRAAAVGLPRRALPPRGRRLRALRVPRLGAGARDGRAARGPLRPGLGAALRPRGRHLALLHAARRAEVAPGADAARARSTSWPTTPTARAATCCWPRTGCGPSTTACASTRTTSCARSSGTSAATRSRPPCRRTWPGWPTTGPPPALCELLEPAEVAATLDRVAWLLSLRALPELVDDGEWPPYPWPLV